MGLGDTARNLPRELFKTFIDFVKEGSYLRIKEATSYDPNADPFANTTPVNDETPVPQIEIIILEYTQREREMDSIRSGDQKAYVKQEDLTGITPSTQDTLSVDGVEYQIVSIKGLPTSTLVTVYEFQLRRKAS